MTDETVRTTPEGKRYSAWEGNMKLGRITSFGYIVGQGCLWGAGSIALRRDQGEIAAEHGWHIEEPAVPADHFDVIATR